MAAQVPLTVPQRNDAGVALSVFEADGVTPQDCTGLTPVMYVKASRDTDDSHAVTLGTGSGLTWGTQSQGTLTALLSHSVTAAAGVMWWRLDLTDSLGDRTTAMYGPLVITAV